MPGGRRRRRRRRRRGGGSCLTTTFPFGLTGPGATDKFYTARLDLEAPLLLRGSGDFMAAARADARERLGLPQGAALGAGEALALEASVREHLSCAFRKCTAFLDSGRVHDREELRGTLEDVFRRKGQMALLLGGKSVGKSQLLAELARRTDIVGADGATRAVLYVDARRFSTNLAAGLQAALVGETNELEWSALRASAGPAVPRRAQGNSEEGASSSSSSSHITSATLRAKLMGIAVEARLRLAEPLAPMQRNLEMLSSVAELAEAQGLHICLVVDEADLAFPTPPGLHPDTVSPPPFLDRERLRDTQQLLERIVQLTMQSRKINALLVSSEYDYAYRLRHGNFFNITNLTANIFAGEVPPADMRALLRDVWGLGPRLSDVFLAFYGGHVHMASQALPELAATLDGFKCERVAPAGALGAIVAALGSSSSTEGRGAADLLRSAALQGFARVQQEGDVSTQALARANLGGLVMAQGLVVGLPESVRGDANFGFVPSSHFMRHLIARELYAERKARELDAERKAKELDAERKARGWLGGWRWPWGG